MFLLLAVSSATAGCSHELAMRIVAWDGTYSDPAKFSLTLSYQNDDEIPLLVLPAQLRRDYESLTGGIPGYFPFPGPALSPWRGALVVNPGETVELELAGMRDGDGTWDLPTGQYRLSLRYDLAADFESGAGTRPEQLVGVRLWTGRLRSQSVHVKYQPAG